MSKKVVVGLSGGVDSAVAALLLSEQGHEVIGMTMQTCADPATPWELEEVAAAARVADHLGIPLMLEDFRASFDREVAAYFTEEYLGGRTPNPCILCNYHIKWRALLRCAKRVGADAVATGHYARIGLLDNGRYSISVSQGGPKDQSYVLFLLDQEALSHTLFPLSAYRKPEVRAIAERAGIPAAHTPDSQDICFVSGHDYAAYLEARAPERMPGEGLYRSAADGRVLGRHRGYIHYTIGQRKGLGIAAGHPLYVSGISPERNEVFLSDTDPWARSLECGGLRFMGLAPEELPPGASRHAIGKVRYAHPGTSCQILRLSEDRLRADFDAPVRAITPGQAAVFYDDAGHILCGGFID